MILFFVKSIPDSDAFVRYCYTHYKNIMRGNGCEAPDEIDIIREGNSKPRAAQEGVYFNLSHSADVTMLGISHTEIGVDIEKVRELDYKKFDFIDADSLESFFEKWTEREAYLKMTGEGLTCFRAEIPEDAHFERFDVFDGFKTCVCAEEQSVVAYEIDARELEIPNDGDRQGDIK